MPRIIIITLAVNTDEVEPELLDLDHPTGLSDAAYEMLMTDQTRFFSKVSGEISDDPVLED